MASKKKKKREAESIIQSTPCSMPHDGKKLIVDIPVKIKYRLFKKCCNQCVSSGGIVGRVPLPPRTRITRPMSNQGAYGQYDHGTPMKVILILFSLPTF